MIVDVHVHVLGGKSSFPPSLPGLGPEFDLGPEALVRQYLDPQGIDQAVLLPLDTHDSHGHGRFIRQEDALAAAHAFPGRFVVFASVDVTACDRADRLQRLVAAGCRGLGEVKYTDMHDPRQYDLYAVCATHGLPVLGHVDSDLSGLEQVLKDFPRVNFIAHGVEFWANMSKGVAGTEAYPKGQVAPNNPVETLLSGYGNLYADVSANSGYNALTRDPEYGSVFVRRFAHKLLYGTDWPCLRVQRLPPERFGEDGRHLSLLRRLLKNTGDLDQVLGGNLLRLLPN